MRQRINAAACRKAHTSRSHRPPARLIVYGQHIAPGTDIGVYSPVLYHRADIFGEGVNVFRPETAWRGREGQEDEEHLTHVQ